MSAGFAELPPRGPRAPQLSRYLVSAILGLALIATLTWWAGEEMRRSALNLRMTETSWQRRTTATAVFRDLRRADAQRLGFEMIGDAHFVANYRPARAQAEHDLRRLAKLCGGDKAQTARVSELRRLLGIKIAEMDATLRLPSRPGAPAAVRAAPTGGTARRSTRSRLSSVRSPMPSMWRSPHPTERSRYAISVSRG